MGTTCFSLHRTLVPPDILCMVQPLIWLLIPSNIDNIVYYVIYASNKACIVQLRPRDNETWYAGRGRRDLISLDAEV